MNLKVLPPGTQVHGGGVMHVFRNSLHVDCSFCHGCGHGKGQAQMIPGWPYSVIAALEPCRTSYADKKGKYQDQKGLTLPFVTGSNHGR